MQKYNSKLKIFISGTIVGIILLFSYLFSLPDGKLHIVFCNVGQGDAAYIRFPNKEDMLIDGGPNDRVLECLGSHMPFYDRTIDVVVLTHPQKDHMQGLISVVQRYNVKYFVIGVERNDTVGYQTLIDELRKRNIAVKNLYKGDKINYGDVKISFLWPDREWVATKVKSEKLKVKSEGAVLGLSTTTDLNEFSYYMHLDYGEFDALFTGDGDTRIQPLIAAQNVLPDIEVLKFPHHGSRTGILPEFLDIIKPEVSVISVGKNSYGHPTNTALDLLLSRNITIRRTDQSGDVEVVSDGKEWRVQ